jgi:hypothetical protein
MYTTERFYGNEGNRIVRKIYKNMKLVDVQVTSDPAEFDFQEELNELKFN